MITTVEIIGDKGQQMSEVMTHPLACLSNLACPTNQYHCPPPVISLCSKNTNLLALTITFLHSLSFFQEISLTPLSERAYICTHSSMHATSPAWPLLLSLHSFKFIQVPLSQDWGARGSFDIYPQSLPI